MFTPREECVRPFQWLITVRFVLNTRILCIRYSVSPVDAYNAIITLVFKNKKIPYRTAVHFNTRTNMFDTLLQYKTTFIFKIPLLNFFNYLKLQNHTFLISHISLTIPITCPFHVRKPLKARKSGWPRFLSTCSLSSPEINWKLLIVIE